MFFVANSLFVLNLIVIFISYVVTGDSQDYKKKLQQTRQEDNFDYWEIDHNVASAIYYEPADSFNTKPFELSKTFFISNPRTDGSSIEVYSTAKTHSSTTKEKRNSCGQNTADETELCVNDTVFDEGTNLLLDVNLAASPSSFSRKSDSKELTELFAIEDIQSTEQKLVECIDLHLFKYKDAIANWQLFLSESKMQMYSKLNQKDIDKEILKKCKNLEDIIETNLEFLKRSLPRRNKDSSTESTTPILSSRTNKVLSNEVIIDDPDESLNHKTKNSIKNSKDSSILTSLYNLGENTNIVSTFSGQSDQPVTQESKITSTEPATENILNASFNELRNMYERNDDYPYRRSNILDTHPIRNQGNGKAFKDNEIKIPTILTKELFNGSVISETNGSETLPNNDFIDFNKGENKQVLTLGDKLNWTISASKLNISDTLETLLGKETTPAGGTSQIKFTNITTQSTPSENNSDSLRYTLAPTGNTLSHEIVSSKENNASNLSINRSTHNSEKWLTGNKSADNVNTSTIVKQIYDAVIDKNSNVRSSQDDNLLTTPKKTSSLNGKLFFDFNGDLVPTHFIQNSEGTINIAIDGKSFCDNVLKNRQSVILNAICKSDYVASNISHKNVVKTNKS